MMLVSIPFPVYKSLKSYRVAGTSWLKRKLTLKTPSHRFANEKADDLLAKLPYSFTSSAQTPRDNILTVSSVTVLF